MQGDSSWSSRRGGPTDAGGRGSGGDQRRLRSRLELGGVLRRGHRHRRLAGPARLEGDARGGLQRGRPARDAHAEHLPAAPRGRRRPPRLKLHPPGGPAGVPALSLPVPSAGPLPASLQLIGPAGSEERLLSAGALLEARWRPPDVGSGRRRAPVRRWCARAHGRCRPGAAARSAVRRPRGRRRSRELARHHELGLCA